MHDEVARRVVDLRLHFAALQVPSTEKGASTLAPTAPRRDPRGWPLFMGSSSPVDWLWTPPSDFNVASGRQHWWLRCLGQDKLRHLSVEALLLGST
ncbi:hypothetical protein E4U43_004348 [Claviceps pusilla]|uniref:Uncharacterized protein n=1 Tax=Claviceps pusilla TaxID=123648 RepID=A0A9P7N612_9HYPO|nr:hypothetical protein E4U43_004348 [Claviceps pusilla]